MSSRLLAAVGLLPSEIVVLILDHGLKDTSQIKSSDKK